jgi:hypothetical protein
MATGDPYYVRAPTDDALSDDLLNLRQKAQKKKKKTPKNSKKQERRKAY